MTRPWISIVAKMQRLGYVSPSGTSICIDYTFSLADARRLGELLIEYSDAVQPEHEQPMASKAIEIPETVMGAHARDLYADANNLRAEIKNVAASVNLLRKKSSPLPAIEARDSAIDPEVIANVTLAYRQLEDASMRLGKALQALDGGVSVYDRATTVGA